MKKSLLLGSKLLLMALLLAACSTKAPSTSPSSTTTEEVTQQQFEAGNGTFSVNLKGDWEAVDNLPGFDLEISSLDQTCEIQLNQYAKVDLFLTVAEMAEKNFIAADGITVLSETSPLETSIADKKGYLRKLTLESEGDYCHQILFTYEDQDFYKEISFGYWQDEKPEAFSKKAEEEGEEVIAQLVESWKSHNVTKDYPLTQKVSLPQTNMSLTLPENWVPDAAAPASADVLYYVSKEEDQAFWVSFVPTNGNAIDLHQLALESASIFSPDTKIEETTVGSHTGYLLHYTSKLNEFFQMQNQVYLLEINGYLLTFHFSFFPSEYESFKPSMEAIIQSLQ